jgi:hypothetical protein
MQDNASKGKWCQRRHRTSVHEEGKPSLHLAKPNGFGGPNNNTLNRVGYIKKHNCCRHRRMLGKAFSEPPKPTPPWDLQTTRMRAKMMKRNICRPATRWPKTTWTIATTGEGGADVRPPAAALKDEERELPITAAVVMEWQRLESPRGATQKRRRKGVTCSMGSRPWVATNRIPWGGRDPSLPAKKTINRRRYGFRRNAKP